MVHNLLLLNLSLKLYLPGGYLRIRIRWSATLGHSGSLCGVEGGRYKFQNLNEFQHPVPTLHGSFPPDLATGAVLAAGGEEENSGEEPGRRINTKEGHSAGLPSKESEKEEENSEAAVSSIDFPLFDIDDTAPAARK